MSVNVHAFMSRILGPQHDPLRRTIVETLSTRGPHAALAVLVSWYVGRPVTDQEIADLYEEDTRIRKIKSQNFVVLFGFSGKEYSFKFPLEPGCKVPRDPTTKRAKALEGRGVPTPLQRKRTLARLILRLLYPTKPSFGPNLTKALYDGFCRDVFGPEVPAFMTDVRSPYTSLAAMLTWLLGKEIRTEEALRLAAPLDGRNTTVDLRLYLEIFGHAYNGTRDGTIYYVDYPSPLAKEGGNGVKYKVMECKRGYGQWQACGGELPPEALIVGS
jgi:hypothetical protein